MKIAMKIKWMMLLMSVGIVGMLVGCSAEADGNVSGDANDMIPEGVENGTVSQEFYDEVIHFFEDGGDFENEQDVYIVEINPDYGNNRNIPFRKELLQHIEEYTTFLETFEFEYKNEAEKELSTSLNEYILKKKEEAEFMDVSISLGETSPESYGMLLMKQEENEELESELYELLEQNKLGYNH